MRRPEHELLLRCARLDLRADDRTAVTRLAGGDLDWPQIQQLADRHGLLPLLHRHLADAACAPRAVLAELWARQERLVRRNRAMAIELRDVLAALESRQILAVPYKGPTLAAMLYGDLALREFGDLDILVAPAHVHAAREALLALGYADRYALAPQLREALVRAPMHYHLVLDRPGGAMVELHWKTDPVHPVERIDDPAWWNDLPRPIFEGMPVRCLRSEELLLSLCIHGSKHLWTSLGWLVDVAEILRVESALDWERIVAHPVYTHARRRVHLGLHLARSLLDAPLPGPIRAQIEAHAIVSRLADEIVATTFDTSEEPRGPLDLLRLDLALHDSRRQRVRSVMWSAFSPTLVEWTRWPLPPPLFALYPLLRMARLTGKYAARALHLG